MNAREPIFNIPTVVVAGAAVLLAVHLVRIVLPSDSDLWVLLTFGFIPARYGVSAALIPGGLGATLWTPLSYALLHGDMTHLLVNLLWMTAFGSAVARRFGTARFLLLSAASAIAGAGLHYVALPDDPAVMIGASAAVSGLTAATARFAFAPGAPLSGFGRYARAYLLPAPSLVATLANPRALFFMVIWFAVNFLFGVNSAILPGVGGEIAWQAHIGGFVAGLFLFGLLDPIPPSGASGPPRREPEEPGH